ncbi:hypothetical protein HYW21_08205 [Candidatus Woesearchaeota archaeon]|nr:hypothetical protein [Candidatus Woesearchaeota archaeon]
MGKVLVIILLFLFIGGIIIYTSLELSMRNPYDQKTFLGAFGAWLWHLGGNTKDLIGMAIKQDWLPEPNKTNITNQSTYKTYIIEEKENKE